MKIYKLLIFLTALVWIVAVGVAQGTQPEFSLTIRDARRVTETSLPVIIDVVRKNISTHVISNYRYRSPLECYSIEVFDEQGNPVAETELFTQKKKQQQEREQAKATGHYVDSIILKTLKPGEASQDGFDVSQFFDMSRPGKYTIQLQRMSENKISVKSNVITVTVTK